MTASDRLLVPTLLPLLESLVNVAVENGRMEGSIQLERVRLDPEGITLSLSLGGLAPGLKGSYPLRLAIEDSNLERTLCELAFPTAPGLQRVVGIGLKAIPDGLLNEALGKFFLGALSVKGNKVVIDHRALLSALRR